VEVEGSTPSGPAINLNFFQFEKYYSKLIDWIFPKKIYN